MPSAESRKTKHHDADGSDDEIDGRPKKQTRTGLNKMKLDEEFLAGTERAELELQCRQHEFEVAQAEKHRECVESRDKDRNSFDLKLQQDMEAHQTTAAANYRAHLKQLAQDNMKFMFHLFNFRK